MAVRTSIFSPLKRVGGRRFWTAAFLVLLIAALASIPAFCGRLMEGDDLLFHAGRIAGVAEGISSGQFPVKLYPMAAYGYGYASPVFYPDLLLYLPAGLYLIGVPLEICYTFFLFFVNLLTAAISYYAFARIFRSESAGALGSLAYTLAVYRLVDLYARSAIGEACAMAFLPLVLYGFFRIAAMDTNDPANKWSFLPLGLGMAGLFATHLLTAAFLLAALLVFLRRFLQAARLHALLKAVLLCLLLSAYFLLPFFAFAASDQYNFSICASVLSESGLKPSLLFQLTPSAWGRGNKPSEYALRLGLGFSYLPAISLYPWLRRKRLSNATDGSARTCVWTCWWLGLSALLLSTDLFPWQWFAETPLRTLQFCWRLLAIASICLSVVLADAVRRLSACRGQFGRATAAMIACLAVFTGVAFQESYLAETLLQPETATAEQLRDLDAYGIMSAEYLPQGTRLDATFQTPKSQSAYAKVTQSDRKGVSAEADVVSTGSLPAVILFPRVYYIGYEAFDGEGNPLPVAKSEDHYVAVTVPAEFSGTVYLRYREKPLWRAEVFLYLIRFV